MRRQRKGKIFTNHTLRDYACSYYYYDHPRDNYENLYENIEKKQLEYNEYGDFFIRNNDYFEYEKYQLNKMKKYIKDKKYIPNHFNINNSKTDNYLKKKNLSNKSKRLFKRKELKRDMENEIKQKI